MWILRKERIQELLFHLLHLLITIWCSLAVSLLVHHGLKVLTLMNFWDSDSRWHLWIGTFPVRVQPETFGVSSVCSNVPCRPARFDKCT